MVRDPHAGVTMADEGEPLRKRSHASINMSDCASSSMQRAGQKSRKHLRTSLLLLVLLGCCGLLYSQSAIQGRVDLASWNGSGCPTKILDLTATMPTVLRVSRVVCGGWGSPPAWLSGAWEAGTGDGPWQDHHMHASLPGGWKMGVDRARERARALVVRHVHAATPRPRPHACSTAPGRLPPPPTPPPRSPRSKPVAATPCWPTWATPASAGRARPS